MITDEMTTDEAKPAETAAAEETLPERRLFERDCVETVGFVYIVLNEGAYSMVARYLVEVAPTNFAESSGNDVALVEATAKPGSIVDGVAEVPDVEPLWPHPSKSHEREGNVGRVVVLPSRTS